MSRIRLWPLTIRQSGNPRLSQRLHRLRKRHLPPRPARPDSPISTAPTFTMGQRFELARMRSKVLLIHFWDSASEETAKKDAEILSHLRSQYGDQGLEVGITSESNQDRIRSFNENAEAVWPLVRDRGGLAEKYGVNGSSEIFVLDSRHKIVSSGARPADLEEMVGQRLGRR